MEDESQGKEKIFDKLISKSALLNMLEDLYTAKAELNQIFETAGDGMQVVDKDFNVLRINKMFLTLSGVSKNEAVGKKCYEVFPGPLCHTPQCALRRLLGGEERVEDEVEKERKDDKRIPCILVATPFRAPDGEVIGIVENFKDITERKKAEEALREAKDYTDSIIKSMIDTLIITDSEGKIKTVNQATLNLLGYEEEEIIGQPANKFFAAEEEETLFKGESLEKLVKEGSVRNFDMTYKTKTGEKIPVSFTGSVMRKVSCPHNGPISDCAAYKEKGKHCEKILGIVGVARDMRETLKLINDLENSKTELEKTVSKLSDFRKASIYMLDDLNKTSKDLTEAKESLEDKTKELESFVYTVSHDLKAPLISIEGFSSSLLKRYRERLNNKGKHYLERIQYNVGYMEHLIEDLLELSRIGRMIGEQGYIDVEKMVKDIKEEFSPKLQEKNIEFSINGKLPKLWADKNLIRQVFENLVGNAVQYMGDQKNPKIEIGAETIEDKFFQAYVRDNGIGIEKQYHKKIFKIFERLNEIEVKGTGVGLAIVKKILECHGGTIWVDSEKGKGSTFYFLIPNKQEVKKDEKERGKHSFS